MQQAYFYFFFYRYSDKPSQQVISDTLSGLNASQCITFTCCGCETAEKTKTKHQSHR